MKTVILEIVAVIPDGKDPDEFADEIWDKLYGDENYDLVDVDIVDVLAEDEL